MTVRNSQQEVMRYDCSKFSAGGPEIKFMEQLTSSSAADKIIQISYTAKRLMTKTYLRGCRASDCSWGTGEPRDGARYTAKHLMTKTYLWGCRTSDCSWGPGNLVMVLASSS